MKKTVLIILSLFLLVTLGCGGIGNNSEEENEVILQYQEGRGNSVEFELLFKNMFYSFVKAKVLSENYMFIEKDANNQKVLQVLNDAEKSIRAFNKILEEEIHATAVEQKSENPKLEIFSGIHQVNASNLWDPTLQEVSPMLFPTLKEGSPAILEISDQEKARRVASLYRNAPMDEKVEVFNHLTQTLQADILKTRTAIVDLAEIKGEYHKGHLSDLELMIKTAEISAKAGDVALFGLDVATGPIPTSLGLRILTRSVLTIKGVDAFLAVGEGVSIAMGNEHNLAGFTAARETFEDTLTLISIGDIGTSGIASITDITKIPGTLKFVVDETIMGKSEKRRVNPNILFLDLESNPKFASIKFFHSPNLEEMVLDEDSQKERTKNLREEILSRIDERLKELKGDIEKKIDKEYFQSVIDFDNPGLTVDDIAFSDLDGISNMEQFRNCLCRESCKAIDFICSGGTACSFQPQITYRDNTPSCSKIANGVCRCAGFGCYRTQMIVSGEAFKKCYLSSTN